MDRKQILKEVIEYMHPPRIQPDEFTVIQFITQYREVYGSLSIGQARRRLNRCVEAGTMGRRKILLDGYITNVYHLIKEDENGHNQAV